jgi:hypothetical protein
VDKFFRFSDYDVFGYLVAGIVTIALYDITVGTNFVLKDSWSIPAAVSIVIAGYVLGHIVSGLAAGIIDRGIVRGLLGTPANLLMRPSTRKSGWIKRAVLGDFLMPLNPSLRDRVLNRAGMSEHEGAKLGAGEDLFWRAWPVIKREPIPYSRAESFLKLYGFCRSMSLISFIAALIFLTKACTGWYPLQISPQKYLLWGFIGAVVAFVMFRRYLRFFRLYGVEVFSTFAES